MIARNSGALLSGIRTRFINQSPASAKAWHPTSLLNWSTGGVAMGYVVPRVQIVPQPDDQVSFQVQGQEKLRWHTAARYPRPHFFPLVGPSGRSVQRMG